MLFFFYLHIAQSGRSTNFARNVDWRKAGFSAANKLQKVVSKASAVNFYKG